MVVQRGRENILPSSALRNFFCRFFQSNVIWIVFALPTSPSFFLKKFNLLLLLWINIVFPPTQSYFNQKNNLSLGWLLCLKLCVKDFFFQIKKTFFWILSYLDKGVVQRHSSFSPFFLRKIGDGFRSFSDNLIEFRSSSYASEYVHFRLFVDFF